VCIYAFPKNALEAFSKNVTKTPLEEEEDIEILRFLEMGYEVQMVKMSKESIPIDHPEDVDKVLERLQETSFNKVILWDFDGVIMDSMAVRDKGFEAVLYDYPADQVALLMDYHRKNGGLSRYHKFRYFFEDIRKESVTESQIQVLAITFSKLMLENLLNPTLLINDSLDFIKENHTKFEMHIVSGSDQAELRYICEALGISKYFVSIHGSPTPKIKLVQDLLKSHKYEVVNTCLIGDSINDYEAANINKISFFGFNNENLKKLSSGYIECFNSFFKESTFV
jgi:phosphoglycolate phosphatase-like HAD superfamily hydrolase